MNASVSIQFPTKFRGVFADIAAAHGRLLVDALRDVHAVDAPAALDPFLSHITAESNQPSFLLLPLMFLAAAEASGGIKRAHIDALPTLLLSMEVVAIADDTVDRTPMRSGRMSFPGRFGDASATPFTGALLILMSERAKHCPSAFVDATHGFLLNLFSMLLWERQNTYPAKEQFLPWMVNRYGQTRIALEYGIDGALALNGLPALPRAVMDRFSRVFQDVDDIVGLVERRDEHGENDDLQMGIITRTLLLTLEREPSLAAEVERLWQHYRPLHGASIVDFQRRHAEISAEMRPLHDRLRATLVELGVPETVRQMFSDARSCVQETPEPLRPFMRALMPSILGRLRTCEHPTLDRLLDEHDAVAEQGRVQ